MSIRGLQADHVHEEKVNAHLLGVTKEADGESVE
jgi:hypothetical protein